MESLTVRFQTDPCRTSVVSRVKTNSMLSIEKRSQTQCGCLQSRLKLYSVISIVEAISERNQTQCGFFTNFVLLFALWSLASSLLLFTEYIKPHAVVTEQSRTVCSGLQSGVELYAVVYKVKSIFVLLFTERSQLPAITNKGSSPVLLVYRAECNHLCC